MSAREQARRGSSLRRREAGEHFICDVAVCQVGMDVLLSPLFEVLYTILKQVSGWTAVRIKIGHLFREPVNGFG